MITGVITPFSVITKKEGVMYVWLEWSRPWSLLFHQWWCDHISQSDWSDLLSLSEEQKGKIITNVFRVCSKVNRTVFSNLSARLHRPVYALLSHKPELNALFICPPGVEYLPDWENLIDSWLEWTKLLSEFLIQCMNLSPSPLRAQDNAANRHLMLENKHCQLPCFNRCDNFVVDLCTLDELWFTQNKFSLSLTRT